MSGHSKWATIKRKKGATDAKRSNMFAKLLRAVEVAAREGGGNVDGEHDARVRGREGEELLGPERQHRARDQARDRRAGDGAEVRGDRLRGLRARRDRAAHRDAHRQPQPDGARTCATRSRATAGTWARRARSRGVHAQGRDRRGEGRRRPTRSACWSWRSRPAPRTSTTRRARGRSSTDPAATSRPCATALGAAGVADLLGGAHDGAADHDAGRRRPRRTQVLRLIEALEDLDDVQNVYANFDIPEEVMASLSWPSRRPRPGYSVRSMRVRVLFLVLGVALIAASCTSSTTPTGAPPSTVVPPTSTVPPSPTGATLADGTPLPSGCGGQAVTSETVGYVAGTDGRGPSIRRVTTSRACSGSANQGRSRSARRATASCSPA